MLTAGLLVYGLFFVLVIVGKFLIDYLKEHELCPCMAKVPFSMLALGVMIYNHYYTDAVFDGIIWIPTIAALLVGNFLIGTIATKFEKLENIGIGFIFASFIYAIASIWYLRGIPQYDAIILYLTAFGLYFLSSFYLLELKLKEVWHEYLYILSLFGMLIFSMQSDVGMSAPIGVGLLLYSEIIRQISRFKDDDVIVDYESAAIYLVAITVLTIPKFIF